MPNIPLRCSPVPRAESKNGLQQSPLRTPRSAEVPKPAAAPKGLQRSKTMFVGTNGASEKVFHFSTHVRNIKSFIVFRLGSPVNVMTEVEC